MSNISIDNLVPIGYTLVNVNRSLLYILIFNLVSNAIKYNSEGGWIRISTLFTTDSFCIEVEDNGIGIDANQISRVFDRFKRVDPTSGEGHGLGLSIVSSIVRFHGGTIDVKSVKGQGSTFKIQLPLKYVNKIVTS